MIRHPSATPSRGARAEGRDAIRRLARAGLRLALPAVAVLAVALQSVALAGGAGPGISLDPSGGPVGTHLTLAGTKFTPGDPVQVGYSSGSCASGVSDISGANGQVAGDGTVSIPITWPQSNAGAYHVCVTDTNTGHTYSSATSFTVTSADPPSITISGPVQSGQPVQVTGAHFLMPGGGTAEVLYGPQGSNGCATSVGTAPIAADGSFSLTFNAPYAATTTTIEITAVDPQGSCGKSPLLVASQSTQVLAAATPTPTPQATTAVTGPSALTLPPSWPPSGPWTVVYCLIGLLLLLLLLLLALLIGRRRRQDQPVTTIKQQDTPVTPASGAGGSPLAVQSRIYAEDPRSKQQTRIADEVTSVQTEYIDPRTLQQGGQGQSGQGGQPPRYGAPPNPGQPGSR